MQTNTGIPAVSPEILEEKKLLRQDVMRASLIVVAIQLFANVFSLVCGMAAGVVMGVMSQVLPFSVSQLMADYAMMITFLTGYLPIMLVELLVIILGWKMFKLPPPRMKSREGGSFWPLSAFSVVGLGVIGQLLTSLLLTFFSLLRIPIYSPDFSLDWSQPTGSILMLLYICIIGPILEEFCFRGVILKLLQRHGTSFAVLFSAVLFALFHMNLVQFCVPVLLGIFLALLTIRSGSLLPAILAHIVNNTMAMVLDMVLPADQPILYWTGYIIYAVIFLGVLAVFAILHGLGMVEILRWRSPLMKLRTQLRFAFTHWSTLVLLGVYLLFLIFTGITALLQG